MRTVSIVTLVAIALVAAAAMPAQADLVPIDYCSTGTTVLQDLQVNANPFPPQKGVPLVINATAMLTEALTSPLAVSVTVSLNGWPLISKSVPDACAVKAGLCPYPAGNFTFGHAIKVPSWIPSGTIGLQVQATNGDGNTIVCASLSITLSSPKPAPDADRVAIAISEIDEPLEAMTHALESMPHSVLSEEERQRALKDFSYALIFGASEPE